MGWIASSTPYLTPPPPGEPDAWTQQAAGRGTQRIVSASHVEATPEVAEALAVPVGEPVLHRVRLISVDGAPVELVSSYYPADRLGPDAAPLGQPPRIKGGAVRLLADLGWTAAVNVEDVSAETAAEYAAPGIDPLTPVLVTRRTVLSAEHVPFEYTVMVAWDRRRQRYTLRAE